MHAPVSNDLPVLVSNIKGSQRKPVIHLAVFVFFKLTWILARSSSKVFLNFEPEVPLWRQRHEKQKKEIIKNWSKIFFLKILQYGYHSKALDAGHLKMIFFGKPQTRSGAHGKFDADIYFLFAFLQPTQTRLSLSKSLIFGAHLGAILDYKLELNSCHHLGRKWARDVVFVPFLRLKLLKNLKCFLLEIDESFPKVRKRSLKQYSISYTFMAPWSVKNIVIFASRLEKK
jgi:hypothetical protein